MVEIQTGFNLHRKVDVDIAALTMAINLAFKTIESKIRNGVRGWDNRQLDSCRKLLDAIRELEADYTKHMNEYVRQSI